MILHIHLIKVDMQINDFEILLMEKQIVEYPCQWSFRIIGAEEALIRCAVEEYMKKAAYQLTASNVSSSGKYVSINLEIIVLTEDVRNKIYLDLKNMSCVKMVL